MWEDTTSKVSSIESKFRKEGLGWANKSDFLRNFAIGKVDCWITLGTHPEVQNLSMAFSVLTKVNELQGGASVRKGNSKRAPSYTCMWCDSKDHTKRDCLELLEALQKRLVKFVGELRS